MRHRPGDVYQDIKVWEVKAESTFLRPEASEWGAFLGQTRVCVKVLGSGKGGMVCNELSLSLGLFSGYSIVRLWHSNEIFMGRLL